MQEARYYEKLEKNKVRCLLCPHQCFIEPGKRGICQVRENQSGRLMSLVYGKAIAIHNDPIEKKPLFHVLPGTLTLSVATVGCNLRCAHCQNYDISQYTKRQQSIPGEDSSAEEIVKATQAAGSQSISFTYSEPTIFMEWAQDIARLAAPSGLRCILVTNGYCSAQPIRDMAPQVLAANVDLKSFRDDFYRHTCGARLQPVLDCIQLMRSLSIWVEVTTLLIPGLNDGDQELKELAAFLVSVDRAMPWHLSRFHPDNDMLDRPPTPLSTIQKAREIGLGAGLRFVYSGNVWGDQGEHTSCPSCHRVIIERHGFTVGKNLLRQGHCPFCSEKIEGIWEPPAKHNSLDGARTRVS